MKFATRLIPLLALAAMGASDATGHDYRPRWTHAQPILDRPLVPFSDCGWCANCEEPGEHSFFEASDGPDATNGEETHAVCKVGWCTSAHKDETRQCMAEEQDPLFEPLSEDQIETLWTMITAASSEELAAFVARLGTAAHYNPERRALQVVDCSRRPILHLPLSRSQARHMVEPIASGMERLYRPMPTLRGGEE